MIALLAEFTAIPVISFILFIFFAVELLKTPAYIITARRLLYMFICGIISTVSGVLVTVAWASVLF